MTYSVLMVAPAGSGLGGEITGNFPSGAASYTVSAAGSVAVAPSDVLTMIGVGFVPSAGGVSGIKYNTNTGNSPLTLAGADITGGADVVLKTTGSLSGGGELFLPTTAQLVAALANPQVNQSYRLRILNDGTGEWTIQTQTGWTLTGTMTLLTNTWRDFIVTVTALGGSPTLTLTDIGAGTAP